MPRIRILRGSTSATREHLAAHASADALLVTIDPERPLAWAGLRSLLAALVEQQGEAAVADAIGSRRAAFSVILPGLARELDEHEALARARLGAAAPGFLAHNGVLQHPLRRAIEAALAPLVEGRTIVVVGAESLDLHSLALLRAWLVADPRLSLWLACDAARIPGDALARREALQVAAAIDMLAASDEASTLVLDLQGPDPDAEGLDAHARPATLSRWDDALDRQAFAALEREPLELEPLLAALEWSWFAFGFTTCLQLGLGLLARAPELTPSQRRRVALLVALAAYNRQVSSRSESPEADATLAELLDHHYRAALEGEDDPLARSHLLYRLALNQGRRRADLPAARELAVAAIVEAQRGGSPYFEAWARNGEAYILGRLGELDAAIAQVEAALALTGAAALPPGLDAELALTQTVLVDNLGMLEAWAGRPERSLQWEPHYVRMVDALDVPYGYSNHWIEHRVALFDLLGAQAIAEQGLRASEAILALGEADLYAAWVGELLYRRGDPAGARAAFGRAGELGHRLARRGEAEASAVAIALADMRSGALERAEQAFSTLARASEQPERAIEYLAHAGQVAALRGEDERAMATINDAIAQAVELGERDVLVRVALAAGEASLALGRVDDAAAAFEQAHALAMSEPPASPADRLAALAGSFAAGRHEGGALAEALELLDPALRDAESWWQLDRVARALLASESLDPNPELAARLHLRLAQRIDVDHELIDRLRAYSRVES